MATIIMTELMTVSLTDAEFHVIFLCEVLFGSNQISDCKQFPDIVAEIMEPMRNGRGPAAELLLPRSSGHNG